MSIRITMTEMIVYCHTYSREEVIEMLDMHEDTTDEALVAMLNSDWEAAKAQAIDSDVFDAKAPAPEDLDDLLCDSIMQHFDSVPEREYEIEVAS